MDLTYHRQICQKNSRSVPADVFSGLSPSGGGDRWLVLMVPPTRTARWGHDGHPQHSPWASTDAADCTFRRTLSHQCLMSYVLHPR